jgi:orotate phosphoribosyltransferase
MEKEKRIASYLLQSKAIKLQPANPFTWASGWNSPIYCDNRKTLSFPEVRTIIRDEFAVYIKEKYPQAEIIAGVATGAIAQGALVADVLNLPFVYIRSEAKKHGLENLIEGVAEPGKHVVVIEDLVSTGGSSLKAVEALRNAGCIVDGMLAIFTYGFKVAEDAFKQAGCTLYTLSNYEALIQQAIETNYVKESDLEVLRKWRQDPGNWSIA